MSPSEQPALSALRDSRGRRPAHRRPAGSGTAPSRERDHGDGTIRNPGPPRPGVSLHSGVSVRYNDLPTGVSRPLPTEYPRLAEMFLADHVDGVREPVDTPVDSPQGRSRSPVEVVRLLRYAVGLAP